MLGWPCYITSLLSTWDGRKPSCPFHFQRDWGRKDKSCQQVSATAQLQLSGSFQPQEFGYEATPPILHIEGSQQSFPTHSRCSNPVPHGIHHLSPKTVITKQNRPPQVCCFSQCSLCLKSRRLPVPRNKRLNKMLKLKFPSPREVVLSLLLLNLSPAKDKAVNGRKHCYLVWTWHRGTHWSVNSLFNWLFTDWILLYKAESKHKSKLCCSKLHWLTQSIFKGTSLSSCFQQLFFFPARDRYPI